MWRNNYPAIIPFLLGAIISFICLLKAFYYAGWLVIPAACILAVYCAIGFRSKQHPPEWLYICITAALLFTIATLDWIIGEGASFRFCFYDVLNSDSFGEPFLISFSILIVVGIYYLILYRFEKVSLINERRACVILATYLYCYSFFTIPFYLSQPAIIGTFRLLMVDSFYPHIPQVIHLTAVIVSLVYGLFLFRLLALRTVSRAYVYILSLSCLQFVAMHIILLVYYFIYADPTVELIGLRDVVYLVEQFFLNFLLSSGVAYSLILLWYRYRVSGRTLQPIRNDESNK